jgi:hypothetical protein
VGTALKFPEIVLSDRHFARSFYKIVLSDRNFFGNVYKIVLSDRPVFGRVYKIVPYPASVDAAMKTSLPVLLCRFRSVLDANCQFDKANGSARSLGPSSIPSLGDGVMLRHGVDRPAGRHAGPALLLPRPFRAAWNATMPLRSATGDQASALAP